MDHHFTLENLHITSFKNLKNLFFEFSPKLNCIYGLNGRGKTNLLESIHILFEGNSFKRKSNYTQWFDWDEDSLFIKIKGDVCEQPSKILFSYNFSIYEEKRQWWINESISQRLKNLNCIFIDPCDFHQFFFTPQIRRNWFDKYFSMLDINFHKSLRSYQKLILYKNKILSHHCSDQLFFVTINQKISLLHAELSKMKVKYIQQLNVFLDKHFKSLFGQQMNCKIQLQRNWQKTCLHSELNEPENFFQYLMGLLEEEKKIKRCLAGTHRDDYTLLINDFDASLSASLGQQKICFLSILFAYIEVFRYKNNRSPMLLMDDISGELDFVRWEKLISFLSERDCQVFITTANESFRREFQLCYQAKEVYLF